MKSKDLKLTAVEFDLVVRINRLVRFCTITPEEDIVIRDLLNSEDVDNWRIVEQILLTKQKY